MSTPTNPKVFEILRAAVTVAKNEQIRTVAKLRARLLELYPGKVDEVKEALVCWANYVKKTNCSAA